MSSRLSNNKMLNPFLIFYQLFLFMVRPFFIAPRGDGPNTFDDDHPMSDASTSSSAGPAVDFALPQDNILMQDCIIQFEIRTGASQPRPVSPFLRTCYAHRFQDQFTCSFRRQQEPVGRSHDRVRSSPLCLSPKLRQRSARATFS